MEHTEYHQSRLIRAAESFDSDDIPSRFSLVLTNKCNLSCSFCFQHRRRLDGQLGTDEWLKFIRNVIPQGSHLTLTGGEPFVFRGFEEIFVEANKHHTTNVITNGTRFNEHLMALLASTENFKVLSISVDTVGNVNRDVSITQYHDMLRMLSIFRDLRGRHGPSLDTKTVVTDENAGDLYNIFKHCRDDIGVDSMSFQMLKGSPIQHADKCFNIESIWNDPSPYQYRNYKMIYDQFERIRNDINEVDVRVYSHPQIYDFGTSAVNEYESFVKEITSDRHDPVDYKTCIAPWESMHVNANGDAFPCLAVKIGNIREIENIHSLYQDGIGHQFRSDLRKCGTYPACSRCGYLRPVRSGA